MIPDLSRWTLGSFAFAQAFAFLCACFVMWLESQRRRTAGFATWLAIITGGPLVWALWLWFTISCHLQRCRLSALAQIDREGRAALQKGHHN